MKQPNRCFAALRSCASVKELPKTSSVGNITRSPLRSSAAKKFAGRSAPLQSDLILIVASVEVAAAVAVVVAAVVVVVRLHLAAVHAVVLLAVALAAVLALAAVALVAVALVAELDRVAVLVALVAVVPEVVADSSR